VEKLAPGCMSSNTTGLTLVEVMAVLAISGFLLVGVWRLYHGSMLAYQRGVQEVRVTQRARTVMRILTRDMQQALATAVPYGIRGTKQQGTHAEADRLELTALMYPTTVTGQAAARGPARLQRIRYQLDPTGETFVLKRVSVNAHGETRERVIPLVERLQSLKVRYFDGQVWYDTWQRATLPHALELTVKLQSSGRDARTHGFSTVVTGR
jgi:type II secretion system protein J